jgi:hypothetical protein
MDAPLLRKTLIAWAGFSGLAVGFVGGYLVPKAGDEVSPESPSVRAPETQADFSMSPIKASTASTHRADRMSSNVPLTGAQRTEAALQVYQSMPPTKRLKEFGRSESDEWVENLPANEIPLFLEGICAANSGPEGMGWEKKSLVNRALRKWWKADRQAVLSWVSGLPPGPTKRFLTSELLESLVYGSDPALAMQLAKDFKARDPEWDMEAFEEKVVGDAINTAWKNPDATAEQMLELYSQLPDGKKSVTGMGINTYPENFDFRKFLDGLFTLVEQDKQPRRIPMDALTEWAKIDPQAATAWFIETTEKGRGKIPFQNWSNISKAVADAHGTQAYYEWASKVLSGASDNFLKRGFPNPTGSEILGIAGATQNPAARDRILAHGLRGADIQSSLRYLGMMSSPEARLRAISENSYHFQKANEQFQLDDAVFRDLGLTREQVNEVIKTDGRRRIIRRAE